MDNRLYKLGCKTGLLNYIDHETPRFYFINANADLDDFDAFCAEITEEYAAEIERLSEALYECARYLEEQVSASYWHIEQPFDANTQRRYDRDMARAHKAFAALGEKE